MTIDSQPEQRHREQAIEVKDIAKWLGHSLIAGIVMFIGLWGIVASFPVERAFRYGLVTALVAFFGGLAYFGIVYVIARSRAR